MNRHRIQRITSQSTVLLHVFLIQALQLQLRFQDG